MYYLVEYERLNSPEHSYFEVRGAPELDINSQPVIDGFCRVFNGVLAFAHGQFATVDEALEALEAIGGLDDLMVSNPEQQSVTQSGK